MNDVPSRLAAVIAVLAIIAAACSSLRQPSPSAPIISSLAVLPLDNLMGDPEQEYFVEGMHEAITSNLSRLSALKVISRTSAMGYYFIGRGSYYSSNGTYKLIPEIARELNVDALVEGSVLKAGDRVRITVQLIHGASDRHLWSNDYEGDLTDILSLQKTIARAIAGEIGLGLPEAGTPRALTPEEEAYLASAPQVHPEAYNLYLKGWYFRIQIGRSWFFEQRGSESIPKAVEYLEQAIALDPDFARAWAALAHSYLLMTMYSDWDDIYGYNRMKEALDKALELDPNQPEAHVLLGLYHYDKLDFSAAEASFRRALELNPNLVYAHFEYGWFLYRSGRPDEALAEFRRALELDPLSRQRQPLRGIAGIYGGTRQYDKSLEYYQAVLELHPAYSYARLGVDWTKREILMQQGRYEEAATEAEKAYAEATLFGEKVAYFWLQLRAEMALGNREKVYSVRDSLRSTGELQQREQEDPFWSAQFYAIMGEKELALSLLERAYEDKTIGRVVIVYDPEFDSLRAEPRFKALLKKLGLTEVFDQNGRRIRTSPPSFHEAPSPQGEGEVEDRGWVGIRCPELGEWPARGFGRWVDGGLLALTHPRLWRGPLSLERGGNTKCGGEWFSRFPLATYYALKSSAERARQLPGSQRQDIAAGFHPII